MVWPAAWSAGRLLRGRSPAAGFERDAPLAGLWGRGDACGGGRLKGGSGCLGAAGALGAPTPRPPLPPALVGAVAGASPLPTTRGDAWPRAGAGATGGTGNFAPAAGATDVVALLEGCGRSGAVSGGAEGVTASDSGAPAMLEGSGRSGAISGGAEGVAASGAAAMFSNFASLAPSAGRASGAGTGAGVGGSSGGSGSGSAELVAGAATRGVEGRVEISGVVTTLCCAAAGGSAAR